MTHVHNQNAGLVLTTGVPSSSVPARVPETLFVFVHFSKHVQSIVITSWMALSGVDLTHLSHLAWRIWSSVPLASFARW